MVLEEHRSHRRTARPGVHVSSTARPMSGMQQNLGLAAPPPHDSIRNALFVFEHATGAIAQLVSLLMPRT